MSRTRLAFSVTGISALLLATLYLATGWFPLTGNPVFAQDSVQATEVDIQAPRRNPIRIGGNVMESHLIYRVAPEYPLLARQAHIEGSVILMVTINEEGLVWEIKVIEGHPMLVDSAVLSVKQWKYSPTLLNGEPAPVITMVTVVYKLMDSDNLAVSMDNSGHVNANPNKLLQTKGTVVLTVPPQIPYKLADDVLQSLLSRGVQKIQVSGSYVLHQGRLYYTGPPDPPEPSSNAADAIDSAFIKVMKQQVQGKTIRFNYRVFISENGDVVGLQQMGSDAYPEFEEAVLRAHVAPALQNGTPVPYARTITHYNIRPYHLR